jgi:hypothetical protein
MAPPPVAVVREDILVRLKRNAMGVTLIDS